MTHIREKTLPVSTLWFASLSIVCYSRVTTQTLGEKRCTGQRPFRYNHQLYYFISCWWKKKETVCSPVLCSTVDKEQQPWVMLGWESLNEVCVIKNIFVFGYKHAITVIASSLSHHWTVKLDHISALSAFGSLKIKVWINNSVKTPKSYTPQHNMINLVFF